MNARVLRIELDSTYSNAVRATLSGIDQFWVIERDANSAQNLMQMIEHLGPWVFDGRQLQNINMGRVHSQKSMLQKLIEQVK